MGVILLTGFNVCLISPVIVDDQMWQDKFSASGLKAYLKSYFIIENKTKNVLNIILWLPFFTHKSV